MFLPEGRWVFSGNSLECLIEIRHIPETSFITDRGDRFILQQQFFRLTDSISDSKNR